MEKFDFIAIDFETANNSNDSACSLGIAGVQNNSIVEEKYYLIQPPDMKFDTKNIGINKLTPIDVKNAPLFPEVWDKIEHYFDGNTIIVAHNAVFDMSVLKDCLIEYKIEIPDFDYVCSIPISTRACGNEKVGTSLEDRTNYFRINIGAHHNSLDDAKACANLVIKCLEIKKQGSLECYCTDYDISIKHFKDLNPIKKIINNNKYKSFEKINISEIHATTNYFDKSHVFYGKKIVFTGELTSMKRKDAMQKVVNLGAIIKNGVSKNTNFLIVGIQDKALVGESGISSKEEKAYDLIKNGYNIKILNESEFLKYISKESTPKDNIRDYSNIINLNSVIVFSSINEKIDKLKKWGILSPKAQEIKDIYYKNRDGAYKCEIIGYLSKPTNLHCLSKVYETILIKANNKLITIAPLFLLEMQKKIFLIMKPKIKNIQRERINMLLQERIAELGSGILTITNSKVKLIGFTCPERLNDYYSKNIQCYFSVGIYDLESLNFSYIKDNALFIVIDKDNNKQYKYQFKLLKKDSIKYKDDNKKMLSKVYYIRKCIYTNKYNYKDMDVSVLFDTKEDLIRYFENRFKKSLGEIENG